MILGDGDMQGLVLIPMRDDPGANVELVGLEGDARLDGIHHEVRPAVKGRLVEPEPDLGAVLTAFEHWWEVVNAGDCASTRNQFQKINYKRKSKKKKILRKK